MVYNSKVVLFCPWRNWMRWIRWGTKGGEGVTSSWVPAAPRNLIAVRFAPDWLRLVRRSSFITPSGGHEFEEFRPCVSLIFFPPFLNCLHFKSLCCWAQWQETSYAISTHSDTWKIVQENSSRNGLRFDNHCLMKLSQELHMNCTPILT